MLVAALFVAKNRHGQTNRGLFIQWDTCQQ